MDKYQNDNSKVDEGVFSVFIKPVKEAFEPLVKAFAPFKVIKDCVKITKNET